MLSKKEKKELEKQAQREALILESLVASWDKICDRYGYRDSEIDRVWQGLIYAATLNIPVKVPTTKEGWHLWDSCWENEFIEDASKNVEMILEKIYRYRYFGLYPSEPLYKVIKPAMWRFVD